MALSIIIAPDGDSWALRSSAIGLDQIFNSGRQAETEGRALAMRLAGDGHCVDLEIVLRDGTMAAVIPFGSAAAA